MNIQKSKTAAIMIATLLIVSIGASMILLPTALAHTPAQNIVTTAHVAALPEIVGVGQHITIYAWLDKIFDNAQPSGSATANTYRFHNYTLTITKPDNATDTLYQDYIADTTSNQAFSYTPNQAGTYTVKFTFPGQTIGTGTAGVDYAPTVNDNPYGAPHYVPNPNINDTYLGSTATITFTVTEEAQPLPIDTYPLPAEYWARPIYGENSIWYLISSNWLGAGAPGYGGFAMTNTYNLGGNGQQQPIDAVGPLTGHIMWTKPLQSGGVVGGNNYDIKGNTYFEGSAYIQRYMNPIIVNGKIYYSEPLGYSTGNGYAETCVDLRTGAQIWRVVGMPQPTMAYIQDVEDYNQHGVMNAYLVVVSGSSWNFYDADTGVSMFNVTGVPGGITAPSGFGSMNTNMVMGPSGNYLKYVLTNIGTPSNPNYTLGLWNSSKLWLYSGNTPSVDNSATTTWKWVNTTTYENNVATVHSQNVTTTTSAVDASVSDMTSAHTRYDWVTPVSWRNGMTSCTILYSIYDDVMLCMNSSFPSNAPSAFMGNYYQGPYTYFAVNLNASRGTVGNILWMKTYDPPANNKTVLFAGVDPVNRVFVENLREDVDFVGYSLDTGAKLWTSTPQAPMDYYGSPASGSISNTFSYGYMYSSAYAGIVYCYDTKTGNVVWTYGNGGAGNSTQGGFDVPGHYPTFIDAIGQGVVYTTTTEHTIETPLYKGALARAINATTGQEIWTLSGYTGEFMGNSYAIADGYATWFNGLDNQIYSVGRGASAMTASAPQAAITQGGSLVISGTVMDVSAGTQQNEQAARFAQGVPVASDDSMCDWMGYVYQQKPMPTNFTGVNVALTVVDPNGNARYIGTTTTDAKGQFSYQWTPDVPGKYTVTASFAGTNGYWPSSAEASFAVDPAAATPTPAPSPPQSMADLYFVPAIVGLLIAIIVVGLLTILVLRKRP